MAKKPTTPKAKPVKKGKIGNINSKAPSKPQNELAKKVATSTLPNPTDSASTPKRKPTKQLQLLSNDSKTMESNLEKIKRGESLEFKVNTSLGEMLIAASSQAEAEKLARKDGYDVKPIIFTQSTSKLPFSLSERLAKRNESTIDNAPHVIVEARAGCLSADTVIHVNRGGNGKQYTIEQVVKQFNDVGVSFTRKYNLSTGKKVIATQNMKPWNLDLPTYVARSVEGVCKLGRLKQAWYSGKKVTYVLITESGRTIRATADHPFHTPEGWKKLKDIRAGSEVHVNVGKSLGKKNPKLQYPQTDTIYHPYQVSNGGKRFKVSTHRLVVEANMNKFSLEVYISILRNDKEAAKKMKFLKQTHLVHHIDENTKNYSLDNLEIIVSSKKHSEKHNWGNNVLWQIGVEKVVSITKFGVEDTYDLEIEDDPHNFVANGFVVHNSGKSTTLLEGIKIVLGGESKLIPSPQQKAVWESMALSAGKAKTICFVAFNKSIATELQSKVPDGCSAMTMHSMGLKSVVAALGRMNLDDAAFVVFDYIAEILGVDGRALRRDSKKMVLVKAVEDLVGMVKMNLSDTDYESLDVLTSQYDIDTNGCKNQVYDLVPQVIEKCKNPKGRIDYNDMIYLPVILNLPVTQYDLLLVDECLPSWTPVMMANGSSKDIKDVQVGDRVRSYNTAKGKPMNCTVSATQKIPNRKPLVKVRVKQDHRTGTNRTGNFVVCTTDHKIWTINRGWVQAGDLVIGDSVIVETAAKTTQKGKISKKGRDNLSEIHIGNKKGVGQVSQTSAADFNRIKGGNGRGLTTPQQLLLEALGNGWYAEYVLPTKKKRPSIYPTHYKLDLANPKFKIVIEIDGYSHAGNEEIDAKKEAFLVRRGWTVYRFKNRDIAKDFSKVLETVCPDGENCPRPATVVSVDETYITEHYVYDITVENCHNFYANGILVHNCQDLNRCQHALTFKAGKRIIGCGDPKQSIYSFCGAAADSMGMLEKQLRETARGVQHLPLTVTRRCGKAIVKEANKIVPDFYAHESNPEGKVSYANYKSDGPNPYDKLVQDGDMVLCRCNAPLVSACFKFLKAGRRANIQGRDIGKGIVTLIEKLKAGDVIDLVAKLSDWLHKETAKENAKRNPSDAKIIALQDKADCLICFTEGIATVEGVIEKVESVFSDTDKGGIRLSSIHRAKGLEASRVHFLNIDGSSCPHALAKTKQDRDAEFNLLYVGVTRAIDELVWVS